jgi:isopenicillin N synthase-like dioxygenase
MPLTNIPVIDIAPFYSGDAKARQAVAKKIGEACEQLGFLVIVGHRIPEKVVDDCAKTARAFFDLPLEKKMAALPPEKYVPRGYAPMAGESLAALDGQVALPDLKEAFDMGQIQKMPPEAPAEAAIFFAPNIWPEQPAGMRAAFEAYYDTFEDLATDIMALFALALDLPQNFFEPFLQKGLGISVLRAINYPDQPTAPAAGQLRGGAHCDYSTLTICQIEDKPGGLQIRMPSGEWMDVPVVPGAFVINLGDLMARWTNDRWVSTMHRVVNPPRDAEGSTRRQSLIFFHGSRYNAPVECLPGCSPPGVPPKYEPIGAGDYLVMRFSTQNQPVAA